MAEWLKLPEACWTDVHSENEILPHPNDCHGFGPQHPNQPQWRVRRTADLGPGTPGRRTRPAWDSGAGVSCACPSQNPLLLPCKSPELFVLTCVERKTEGSDTGGAAQMIDAHGPFASPLLRSQRPCVCLCLCIQQTPRTCTFCMSPVCSLHQ